MRIKAFYMFLLAIWMPTMAAIDGEAQTISTMGQDFWVSFMPNSASPTPKLEILIAGQQSCTGAVTNPLTGWSDTFSVTPGVVTSLVIPNSEAMVESENKVEHKAIHVTTTADVSLYASNFVDASYDVANVLPTSVLKDNYIAQSYYSGPQSNMNSKLLIVAVENNTEITVNPRGGLRGVFPPLVKKVITLNAGECYLFISAIDDISGTSVNVKDGKKVAVFSGGEIAVPNDKCCYDLVFEQSVPMAYWGRHFVVTASAQRSIDMVRITSLASGCRISIDGKYRRTLGAKKYFDYKLDGSKKEAVYISASSPISVCVYLTSADYGGIMGDPSMVNINPIEQQMDKVTFASYNTALSKFHYVNVVTLTAHVKSMTLDGASIASEFQPVPKKKELSYARIGITHGSHTLETADGGFVAHIYGLGNYESYAYTVGSNSKILNEFDEDGNLILNTIPNEFDELDEPDGNLEDDSPEPVYVSSDTLPIVKCDSISLVMLKNGVETKGILENWNDDIEDGTIVDVVAESGDSYLLDPLEPEIVGDTIILSVKASNNWCDCFVPSQIEVDIIVSYESNEGLKKRVVPMTIPINRERSWLSRCLWVVLTITGLLLFVLYLRALLRKRRFKKSARIKHSYMELRGGRYVESELQDGIRLREKGFVAWVKRWLVPFPDERRTPPMWLTPPAGSITFVAAKSKEVVDIKKQVLDSDKLRMEGYDPDSDDDDKDTVEMDTIRVYRQKRYEGRLEYDSGSKDDEKHYRIIICVLIMASILVIGALILLMIKGLL